MAKTHYKLDRADAARRGYRDAERELEEAKAHGFVTWKELEIVPIKDIQPQKVWNPPRIERIREGLDRGAALPAISLARTDGGRYRYAITDGIHRYNASVDAGFTHIPAMVTYSKETPELLETPKVFRAGTYVRFKKPFDGRWEYGYLVENLFNDVFVTVAGDANGADWVGDLDSSYFEEEVNPPSRVKDQIQNHWFFDKTSSQRIAYTYLGHMLRDRTAKNVPKKVDEYVKKFEAEGKDPGYAYALAWSIYCKHKNPDSPHCKADSYLDGQGKKSSSDVLYHVTYARNLEGIGAQGLVPGRGSNFGGAYRGHSSGRVFLCDFRSVKFWIGKLWDMAEANSDTPLEDGLIPVALKVKVPRGVEIHVDEAGARDSRGGAFYVEDTIPASNIAYWDGFSYSSVSDADVEDIVEEAKDNSELEDYGDGEIYYDFGYGDYFMPKKATMAQRVAARVMQDQMVARIAARVVVAENDPTNPDLWKKVQELVRGERKSLSVGDKTYDAPRDGKGFKKHPCVPMDTEALTPEGWKLYEDLEVGDLILAYDLEDDTMKWSPILNLHFHADAPVMRVYKPRVNWEVRCTPDHNWVTAKKGDYTRLRLATFDEMSWHNDAVLVTAPMSDGFCQDLRGFVKYEENWTHRVMNMSPPQREAWFAASIVYDGWQNKASSKTLTYGASQKDPDHLNAIIMSAFLTGHQVSLHKPREDSVQGMTIMARRHQRLHNALREDLESQPVWCPETRYGTWVMRQGSQMTITGNSAYSNGWAVKVYGELGGGWKAKD